MIRVRVSGVDRLGAALRRLRVVRTAAMTAAVARGARDIRDAARRELPRRSGRLAQRVTIETAPDGLAATVGTDVDYGTYLELGTRRMTARPWLLPAFRGLRARLRANFARGPRAKP
jgi:HK97 gp10 family phage protein